MGKAEVTPEYVNLITNDQYATRTANSQQFAALKEMFSVYLNSNPNMLPDRKYTHGLALLIAHYYTSGPKDGSTQVPNDSTAGPLSQQSVGDVSQSWQKASSDSSSSSAQAWNLWLEESTYGRQFITLMRSFKPLPVVCP